ncbi:MAG: restriction endonuclease subunit S [Parcubacteria group bacterium]
MINFSIIQKSQLEGAMRIDAEYYQPEFFIDFTKGKWKSIGDVLKKCQYGLSLAMNDEKNGYPMFKMNDIDNAFLLDDDVRYADISKNELANFTLEEDDVLFNRVNSEEFVGRTGIFKIKRESVFASYLIRLQPNKNEVLPDYLNIFLNSKFGLKQIKKYARRAVNQANVNAEELKQFKIAILPINIQEEIKKLSNESWREFQNSKLFYQQAERLLLDELGLKNFDNEEKLSSIVHLSEIEAVCRIDAEYFQPKYKIIEERVAKYNVHKLGDLVSMKKGIEVGAEEYQEEGRVFIRVSSMTKFGIVESDQKYLSDKLYEKLKADFEPKKGEILLTKDATPGIAFVLKKDIQGIVSGGTLRLKLKNKEVEAEYLALCLNSKIGQMQAERDAGGSVIAHWKPEQIKNVLIPILPKETQQKIAKLVQKSHEARKKAKELLEEAKRKVEDMIENN